MRADAVRAVHDVDHVVADFQGLDGTQADAGHVGFLDQAVQDVGQRRMVVEVAAIGAEVDAGQDDFLMSARRKFRRFPPNILEFPAAVAASGVWHDAI